MLVITRKINESFEMFEHGELKARVTMYRAADGKVRLGIEAPPSVVILRSELLGRDTVIAPEAA